MDELASSSGERLGSTTKQTEEPFFSPHQTDDASRAVAGVKRCGDDDDKGNSQQGQQPPDGLTTNANAEKTHQELLTKRRRLDNNDTVARIDDATMNKDSSLSSSEQQKGGGQQQQREDTTNNIATAEWISCESSEITASPLLLTNQEIKVETESESTHHPTVPEGPRNEPTMPTTTATTTAPSAMASSRNDRTVHVHGVPSGCTVEQVREFFCTHLQGDDIESIELPSSAWNESSWAEITFCNVQSKQEALCLNGLDMHGSRLTIAPYSGGDVANDGHYQAATLDDASLENALRLKQVAKNMHEPTAEGGCVAAGQDVLERSETGATMESNEDERLNHSTPSKGSTTIVIFDLPRGSTKNNVRSALERFGPIQQFNGIRIIPRNCGPSLCFVDFEFAEHARSAVDAGMSGSISIFGVKCSVDFDRKRSPGADSESQKSPGLPDNSLNSAVVIFNLSPATTTQEIEAALQGYSHILPDGIHLRMAKDGSKTCFVNFECSPDGMQSSRSLVEYPPISILGSEINVTFAKRAMNSGEAYYGPVGSEARLFYEHGSNNMLSQEEKKDAFEPVTNNAEKHSGRGPSQTASIGCSTVVLFNVPPVATGRDVQVALERFGPVSKDGIRIISRNCTTSFCFVDFVFAEHAKEAVERGSVTVLGVVCDIRFDSSKAKGQCAEGMQQGMTATAATPAAERPSSNILIYGLDPSTTSKEVEADLRGFGRIVEGGIRVTTDRGGTTICFVAFESSETARRVVEHEQRVSIRGKSCRAMYSTHSRPPSRAPHQPTTEAPVPSPTIAIQNLSPSVMIEHVKAVLANFGRIHGHDDSVRIIRLDSGKRVCFVDFESIETAKRVVEHEQRVTILGETYRVGYNRPRPKVREEVPVPPNAHDMGRQASASTSTIAISGLGSDIRVEHIQAVLANFGRIHDGGIRIVQKGNGNVVCFVDFESAETAQYIVEQERKIKIFGRTYTVGYDHRQSSHSRTMAERATEDYQPVPSFGRVGSMHASSSLGASVYGPETTTSARDVKGGVGRYGATEMNNTAYGREVEHIPPFAAQGQNTDNGTTTSAPNSAIVLYGLVPNATQQDVALAMCQFGRILFDGIRLKRSKDGFHQMAFVDFDSTEAAKKAVEHYFPIEIAGQRCHRVEFVRRPEANRSITLFRVPPEASRADIQAALSRFGRVESIQFLCSTEKGGTWTVSFEQLESARTMVEGGQGYVLVSGQECRVDYSKFGGGFTAQPTSSQSIAHYTAQDNRTTDCSSRNDFTGERRPPKRVVVLFGVPSQARSQDVRSALAPFGRIEEPGGVRLAYAAGGRCIWTVSFDHVNSARALVEGNNGSIVILGYQCRAKFEVENSAIQRPQQQPTRKVVLFGVPSEARSAEVRTVLGRFGWIRPNGICIKSSRGFECVWTVEFEDVDSARAVVEGNDGLVVIMRKDCRAAYDKYI